MRGFWQPMKISSKNRILGICDIPTFKNVWAGFDFYEKWPKKETDFYFKMLVELAKISDPILHLESTFKTSKYLNWGIRAQF